MARVFRSQQDVADARLAYLVEREKESSTRSARAVGRCGDPDEACDQGSVPTTVRR